MIGWGIFFLICALVSVGNVYRYESGFAIPIIWALIGSVLIAGGVHRNRQRQEQAQNQTVIVNNYVAPQQAGPQQTVAEIAEENRRSAEQKKLADETREKLPEPKRSVVSSVRDGFPVAGVTFRNDDGTSRQKILRELCDGEDFVSVPVELEPYEYKGEDAVRVVTPEGCVGNIRREDVEDVMEMLEDGPKEIYMEINTFENENGRTIWRGDVHLDY